MRANNSDAVFELNVKGTRILLEEALAAKVERVVHTSSVAAIGPARARGTADESQLFTAGHLGIDYANSKHEAEVEALRLAAHGLPVVIVNPSFVLGPDDPKGTSMDLVRRFLLGRIPAYVDGGLNIVDVRDVARGHLLADEKGQMGERYILAGRNFTLDRLFADFARISGREQPPVKLPGRPTALAVQVMVRAGLPLPVSPDEVRSATLWWTYRNTKARRELGFEARPHEETLEDAVRWQMDQLGDRVRTGRAPQEVALAALAPLLRLGGRVLGG
jgi:dihydroflavonol-4-reductase